MKEVRYMISDTARKVDVEAHVLRYWEDELELHIGRTEMGHRYYTPEDIRLFKNIKELKEQGFQLKAIKMLLPELTKAEGTEIENFFIRREELNGRANEEVDLAPAESGVEDRAVALQPEETSSLIVEETCGQASSRDGKIVEFQKIIKNVVLDALQENNEGLQKEVGRQVSDHVIKEVDYMMRMQDEREEERFKRLDETIRNLQKSRQEVAVTKKEEKKRFQFLKKGSKFIHK